MSELADEFDHQSSNENCSDITDFVFAIADLYYLDEFKIEVQLRPFRILGNSMSKPSSQREVVNNARKMLRMK